MSVTLIDVRDLERTFVVRKRSPARCAGPAPRCAPCTT